LMQLQRKAIDLYWETTKDVWLQQVLSHTWGSDANRLPLYLGTRGRRICERV
jgi:hypothetical protein